MAVRLTEAKSGAVVQVTSVESAAIEKAGRGYADGLSAFNSGRPADAEKLFAAATQNYSGDARYWYFLGLSRHQQGKVAEAEVAFKRGAELESRGKPTSRAVSEAFERLPLALRQVVKAHRP
jgi:Flp pilus assembly protein TadD